jgi:SNF2-related domain
LLICVLAVLDPAPDAPGPQTLSLAESRELDLDLGPGVDFGREQSQIYHAAADTEKTASSNSEIDETKVWTNIFKHCFRRVICDEGHKLKNSRTKNHRAVFKVFAPSVWILTATPMLNSAVDVLGYLNLFWREDWDFGDDYDIDAPLEDIYSASFRQQFRKEKPEYGKSFELGFQHLDLYVLHPKHFATLSNRGRMTGMVAFNVLRSILSLLQLRLSVAHQLEVNGRKIRVGDQIPMYRITTVELKMNRFEESKYREMWRGWNTYLSQPCTSSGGGHRL